MKNALDVLSYLGGLFFMLMLLSGVVIYAGVTLWSMWIERHEYEEEGEEEGSNAYHQNY